MPIEKRPSNPIARGIRPGRGQNHRVADGETLEGIARTYGTSVEQLLKHNFATLVPAEINWYLREYVGCKLPTKDGKNWRFSNTALPGLIYLPQPAGPVKPNDANAGLALKAGGVSELSCEVSDDTPKWGLIDLAQWKLVPEQLGGGIAYIQGFKDAWVRHNKASIKSLSSQHRMPAELLAGVCWIEVGGDPNFVDKLAFEVRTFDRSGPDWVDKNLTITNHPTKTSFGSVSIQLRTAAQTLGLDPSAMSSEKLRTLASCLERDVFNIKVVALHLRQLIDIDSSQNNPPALTFDEVRIVGARYNRGVGLSMAQIRKNTSYGDFIVKHWPRFTSPVR